MNGFSGNPPTSAPFFKPTRYRPSASHTRSPPSFPFGPRARLLRSSPIFPTRTSARVLNRRSAAGSLNRIRVCETVRETATFVSRNSSSPDIARGGRALSVPPLVRIKLIRIIPDPSPSPPPVSAYYPSLTEKGGRWIG